VPGAGRAGGRGTARSVHPGSGRLRAGPGGARPVDQPARPARSRKASRPATLGQGRNAARSVWGHGLSTVR